MDQDLEVQPDQSNPNPYFAKQLKRGRRLPTGQPLYSATCFRDGSISTVSASTDICVSCTTFNILAPIYKRMNGEDCRESQFRDFWLSRNERILEMLCWRNSSIICLQEFWLGNNELVRLYEQQLGSVGYEMFQLARTNNKGDGLLTAIKNDQLRVLDYREVLFHDCGDRVAQFFHVQSLVPVHKKGHQARFQEMLLLNTHLLFPHNSNCCLIRLRQVFKILNYLEHYKVEHGLFSVPIILCGDWNGSKRGQVYKFLRSQGFVSSYDVAHQYTDNDIDAHRWISHRNHRGNVCGVDFIWLLNPIKQTCSLAESWKQAVFGIIKLQSKLREAGLKGKDAFSFFKSKNLYEDNVTLHEFHEGLRRLGLTQKELEGLTKEEIGDLMLAADFNGDGVIGYDEFQVASKVVSRSSAPLRDASNEMTRKDTLNGLETVLDVKDAFLYPPEVEQGRWPENYSLSDHAPLTAVFSPVYGMRQVVA
ncbi:hypothetical protein O6H91_21G015000 [Diphasiastrum complanatum]|uniref:Uncharacterized protein n=2 Tax=Diphasiastrum complanatum TaxID=34168 RepID=A0ACC2AI26_DIPCM|nr:hypothetical protein O6H91_21G015000 [Diphasiastrum complanatum]KAJ7517235.1 hypothetical protein O6H91_21G015000 [Diphasiastrum complanatum]